MTNIHTPYYIFDDSYRKSPESAFTMENKQLVPALTRAHKIMTALIGSPWSLGISELSRQLDLSKSTVHGLVHTLEELGLLERETADERKYRPAGRIVGLWREAQLKGNLARAARPLLDAFSERHGLTALAGVFLPGKVLVVEAVLAPGFSISAYAGQMVPVWAGALGKLLLASMPPRRAQTLVERMAEKSRLDQKAYLAEVRQARKAGVALDREEYIEGVRALAAAVPSRKPQAVLRAVWVVGLAPAMDEARLAVLSPELVSLGREIGWRTDALEENRP